MKRIPYYYVLDFGTAVAAGADADATVTIDNDKGDFIIEDYDAEFFLNATSGGGSIISTPLAREALPTDASNTFPTLAALDIEFRDPEAWGSGPMRVSNWVRKGSQNMLLTQRRVGSGKEIKAALHSYLTALAVKGQVVFYGYHEQP